MARWQAFTVSPNERNQWDVLLSVKCDSEDQLNQTLGLKATQKVGTVTRAGYDLNVFKRPGNPHAARVLKNLLRQLRLEHCEFSAGALVVTIFGDDKQLRDEQRYFTQQLGEIDRDLRDAEPSDSGSSDGKGADELAKLRLQNDALRAELRDSRAENQRLHEIRVQALFDDVNSRFDEFRSTQNVLKYQCGLYEVAMMTRRPVVTNNHQPRFISLEREEPKYVFFKQAAEQSLACHRQGGPFCEKPLLQFDEIELVSNETLYRAYLMETYNIPECEQLQKYGETNILRIPHAPNQNECIMWHGSSWQALDSICLGDDGLDPRRGGSRAGDLFGQGSYVTPVFSKSDLYGKSGKYSDGYGPWNWRCVIAVAALIGKPHEATDPCPYTWPPDEAGVRCHSVRGLPRCAGGMLDHEEFALYKAAQTLPLARIWYRHETTCRCSECTRAR